MEVNVVAMHRVGEFPCQPEYGHDVVDAVLDVEIAREAFVAQGGVREVHVHVVVAFQFGDDLGEGAAVEVQAAVDPFRVS